MGVALSLAASQFFLVLHVRISRADVQQCFLFDEWGGDVFAPTITAPLVLVAPAQADNFRETLTLGVTRPQLCQLLLHVRCIIRIDSKYIERSV